MEKLLTTNEGKYKGSATSIEMFNSCPYKFFLDYSL